MRAIIGNGVTGIPALLGVLLGIKLFAGGADWFFATLLMIALAALCCTIGSRLLASNARLGRWLIEVWILSAIGVTALATALIIRLGLDPPIGWLGDPGRLGADAVKQISSTLLGAVSAFVALAWTKDIGDAKGFFWPSTMFKAGLGAAYERLATRPPGGSKTFEAFFEDTVDGEGNLGWDFAGRRRRTEIVADWIAGHP